MRWMLLLALCVLSCARPKTPEDLYGSAVSSLRAGELETAARQAAAGVRFFERSRPDWYWTFRLLEQEVLLARGSAKQALSELQQMQPTCSLPRFQARHDLVLANATAAVGDYANAHRYMDRARRTLAKTSIPDVLVEADVLEGLVHSREKNYDRANAVLERALHASVAQREQYWQTAALLNLGFSRLARSRHDEAIPYLQEALASARGAGARRLLGIALLNLGICRYRLGDFANARAALEEAVRVHGITQDRRYLQASLGEIGNVYALEGRPRQAIPYYEKAFRAAEELGTRPDAAIWATNLALAWVQVEDWDQADKWNTLAHRRRSNTADPKALIHNDLNAAQIAKGRSHYRQAEQLYMQSLATAQPDATLLWDVHAGLADLYARTGRTQQARRHYEKALAFIEQSRADLLRTEYKLTYLSNLITFYQAYVEMLLAHGQYERALDVVDSSRARILLGEPGPAAKRNYRDIARRAGATFLVYWLAPNGSSLWVITAQGMRYFRLPPSARLEELVDAHIRSTLELRDPLQSDLTAGRRLYEELVAPAHPYIGPDAKVTAVLDGVLHGLNLETLPTPEGRYWIQDVTLSVAPSLRAAGREPLERRAPRKSLLLIGDTEPVGPDYPRLTHARAEMEAIERSLPEYSKLVYRGAKANPGAYRQSTPAGFSIIHFATHADANALNVLESSIILSPREHEFKLYARDVAGVPLQAQLITLSACRGAGARAYAGEGLIGLAWAFLHAGARNVIASLWDVNDTSTARMMQTLYAEIARGNGFAASLRTAKLRLLESPDNFRKPYYWGPFLLYTTQAGM